MSITSWQAENLVTGSSSGTGSGVGSGPGHCPRYDNDVRTFLEDKAGSLLILSEDTLFIKTVRAGVLRALQIKRDCVGSFRDSEAAMTALRSQARANVPVLALVDRIIAGKPTTEFIRMARQQYPALKLIVLTFETTKESLSLLFEIGVDHVITKPVSVDTLIEKMAGVITPQTKISRLVQDARVHLEQGEYDKVFNVCDSILEMKNKSAIALMLRGEAFLRNGNANDAVEEFEKAHKSAPLYLEPLKKLVEAHREGDEEQYLSYMLRLDNISPLNVERKCEIGKCFVRRMEMDNAREFFDKAIEYAQEEAKRYFCSIIADIAQATLEAAPDLSEKYFAQYFDVKGGDLSKEDMVAFNSFGMALRKQGKWQEAIKNYELALQVDPKDLRIMYNYALAQADGEQHRKAVEIYEKILHKEPEFHLKAAAIGFNIANSYYNLKNMKQAKHFLEEALRVDPNHASSKKLLARIK